MFMMHKDQHSGLNPAGPMCRQHVSSVVKLLIKKKKKSITFLNKGDKPTWLGSGKDAL